MKISRLVDRDKLEQHYVYEGAINRLIDAYNFLDRNVKGISASLMFAGAGTDLVGLVIRNPLVVIGIGTGLVIGGAVAYGTTKRQYNPQENQGE